MFNVGLGEIVIIVLVVLLLFGPERLPEMARQAGRFLGRLRLTTQDALDQLKDETDLKDLATQNASVRVDGSGDSDLRVARSLELIVEGSVGYLDDSFGGRSHMVEASWVQTLPAGFTLMPTHIARELTAQGDVSLAPPQLSDRELRWLRALADNGTVLSLARSSGYSEREMYRRLSAVYHQLGARTRTEALLAAERVGLLAQHT